MTVGELIGILFIVGGWLVGWILFWRIPCLERRAGVELASYSVVIPARDEESNIEGLLSDLARQSHRPAQVIVVDDDSSDATAVLAQRAGATVVRSSKVPTGWVGKVWACHQGAGLCSSTVVVFLDADVRLGSGEMSEVVAEVAGGGGLVSVMPWHCVHRPYEWLSCVFGVVATMATGFASMVPTSLEAAFGPCLALTMADYERMGGHSAVRSEVVDDLALARRAAATGVGVKVFGGRPGLTYRMYPTGLGSLIQGWSKNIATGARYTAPIRSTGVFFWVTGALSVAWGARTMSVVALAIYLAWVIQFARMMRLTGSFPVLAALIYPAFVVFFVAIFLRSVVITVYRGEVRWRGRTVTTRSSPVTRG